MIKVTTEVFIDPCPPSRTHHRPRTSARQRGSRAVDFARSVGEVCGGKEPLADQASGNNEVHIQLKLRQTDAKILQAIEEALGRIENGTYGMCRDCGEPIADARLHAIP